MSVDPESVPSRFPAGGPFPTTPAQREILAAAAKGDEASCAYNEVSVLRLRGPADPVRLARAAEAAARRHDALRAVFAPDGLTFSLLLPESLPPVQVCGRVDVPVPGPAGGRGTGEWPSRDAGAGSGDERLEAFTAIEVRTPFDTESGPLFRAAVLCLGPDDTAVVFSAHHVVFDGWSAGVFAAELADLYHGRTLPPAPSFSANALSVPVPPEEDVAFWRDALGRADARPFPPPPSRRRSGPADAACGRVTTDLGAIARGRIAALAREEGATPFAVLLAALASVSRRSAGGRPSGDADSPTAFLCPFAGQPLSGNPGLVGHLVQTLPLVIDTGAAEDFRGLVRTARDALRAAVSRHGVTYGDVVGAVREAASRPSAARPGRADAASRSLPDVIVNFEPSSAPPFEGCDVTFEAAPRAYENFALSFDFTDHGGRITLGCHFASSLYTEEEARRLLLRVARAAEAGTLAPGASPAAPDVRTEEDVLEAALAGAGDLLPDSLPPVEEAFFARAAERPDAPAVTAGGVCLTYGALNDAVVEAASLLASVGVGPGDRVGVVSARGHDLVAVPFAAWRLGAVVVPLDPAHPPARIARCVVGAGCRVVVAGEGVPESLLSSLPGDVTVTRHRRAAPPAGFPRPGPPAVSSEDPAYVMFTSGTTGGPKGVVVSRGALAAFAAAAAKRPGMTDRDRVLAATSAAFDVSLCETVLPFTVGASVVVCDADVARDGVRLARLLTDAAVTVFPATPSAWGLVIESGLPLPAGLSAWSGGEPLPAALARRLTSAGVSVWNCYGPTETTVYAAVGRLLGDEEEVHVGRPLPGVVIEIVGPDGVGTPPGGRGEIYIGGRGVALGYHGNGDLTGRRFVHRVPAQGGPPLRFYKTGDVGRLRDDGTFVVEGRVDDQVKIRGVRVEPREVGDALASLPGVTAVHVAAVTHGEETELVAWVADGSGRTDAEYRRAVSALLPRAFVPGRFVRLDRLPLTPSGKVDAASLPRPAVSSFDAPAEGGGRRPSTPSETAVADVWHSVLGVRPAATDTFFALGGTSLGAMRASAALGRIFGVRTDTSRFFTSTLEEMARGFESLSRRRADAS